MTERALEIIRRGTRQPAPAAGVLRAGPVRVLFTDGDLRQVYHGDTELARRIYVAIRDLDWNTLPGEISDLDIIDRGESFRIRFTRRHHAGNLDYQWRAEIDGDCDGTITYRMRGEALSAFAYAKIGICVHHPTAGYAGQPYRGRTPDGPVNGTLPDAIGPQIHLDDGTDLPLFDPVNDLDVTHASGGVVRFEFSGSLWEMEDQRNWTDASYKSASTPARLGYRHEAVPGAQFDQQVVIRASGFPAPTVTTSAAGPLTLTVGEPAGPAVPPIGLHCADPAQAWSDRACSVLRTIRPAHLRVDVQPGTDAAKADLARAAERARELDCGLELAVFRPAGDSAGSLAQLSDQLAAVRPLIARVLAFSEAEESSSAQTVAAVSGALERAGYRGVPVISGTNIYFNELNRYRIGPGRADGLAWSANPQIHAFDDISLMENLQAQPDTIATARFFAPGTKVYVTPVTLRPRFNAVAVTDQAFPEGALPWQVDVRQPSLLAAAWTLGSVAVLAAAGADGLTYYDTVGPAGVVESPAGSPDPAEFFSQPDTPYPLAVVLADACGLAGGRICQLRGVDPARLAALAVRTAGALTVLAANLTAQHRDICVVLPSAQRASGDRARIRVLDEHSMAAATADLAGFLTSGADAQLTGGAVTVTLHPYAVVRLDVTGG